MSFCIKLVINISPCAWYWTFFNKGFNLPPFRNMIKQPFYILFLSLGHVLKIKKGRKSIAVYMRERNIRVYRPNLLEVFQGHCIRPLPLLDIINSIIGRDLSGGPSALMNYQGMFMRFSYQWIPQSLTDVKWSFCKMHHFTWAIFLVL